jgi:hypothetical protein
MGSAHGFGRRQVVAGTFAGGILGVGSTARASAATGGTRTGLTAAKALRVGDLVLGPRAQVVRLASVERLASGRIRLRYTHPESGAVTPFDAASDASGFPARLKVVVLQRGVKASSVRLSAARPAGQVVVDGGAP